MESTRRLSLTLLLVTPIITARKLSSEDLSLTGSMTTTWSDLSEQTTEPPEDWDSATEQTDIYPDIYAEGAYIDFGHFLRPKRDSDSPGEVMETAEQVLFRPTFRYKHLVKEREKHHRLQQELRRKISQNSPVPASSSPSVASLPSPATPQRKYYNYPQRNQAVYTQSVPTVQRVYTQQIPPQPVYSQPQRVYSAQITTPQRVYSTNSPQYALNYPSSQYPQNFLYPQNNQIYRPQRSPYPYDYSQRIN